MKAKTLVSVGILAIALAFSAQASAKTKSLKGGVMDDANAKVSLKVVVKKGKPKSVNSIKVTNMDYTCQDESEGELAKVSVPGSLKLTMVPTYKTFNFYKVKNGSPGYEVSGTVNTAGTKVTSAGLYYSFTRNGIVCGGTAYFETLK